MIGIPTPTSIPRNTTWQLETYTHRGNHSRTLVFHPGMMKASLVSFTAYHHHPPPPRQPPTQPTAKRASPQRLGQFQSVRSAFGTLIILAFGYARGFTCTGHHSPRTTILTSLYSGVRLCPVVAAAIATRRLPTVPWRWPPTPTPPHLQPPPVGLRPGYGVTAWLLDALLFGQTAWLMPHPQTRLAFKARNRVHRASHPTRPPIPSHASTSCSRVPFLHPVLA